MYEGKVLPNKGMSFSDWASAPTTGRVRFTDFVDDAPYARVTLDDEDAAVVKAAFDARNHLDFGFKEKRGYEVTIRSNGHVTTNVEGDDRDIVVLAARLIAGKYYRGQGLTCAVDFKYATPQARKAGPSQNWHCDGTKDVGTVIFYGNNASGDDRVPLTRFRKNVAAYEFSGKGRPFYTAMLFDNTQCEHAGPDCDNSEKGPLLRIGLVPNAELKSGFADTDSDWKPWTY